MCVPSHLSQFLLISHSQLSWYRHLPSTCQMQLELHQATSGALRVEGRCLDGKIQGIQELTETVTEGDARKLGSTTGQFK